MIWQKWQLTLCLATSYKAVEDSFVLHSTLYAQTVDAGRHLCETMVESECQSRLQSELQAVQKAWEHTSSVLDRRRDMVNTTVQVAIKFPLNSLSFIYFIFFYVQQILCLKILRIAPRAMP